MNYKKVFNKFIRRLQESNDNKILYRNNFILLKNFFEFLVMLNRKGLPIDPPDALLVPIKDIDSITVGYLEKRFDEILQDIELQIKSDIPKTGVYFLFNNENDILYVGKSKNLPDRIKTSFRSKIAYGVVSLKFVGINPNLLDITEAILIDYYTPILNNQFEKFDCNHKTYTKLIRTVEDVLKQKEYIYPIPDLINYSTDETLDVFDTDNLFD